MTLWNAAAVNCTALLCGAWSKVPSNERSISVASAAAAAAAMPLIETDSVL